MSAVPREGDTREAENEQMRQFMKLMPVHPAFDATNVYEVYQSWRDSGMFDFLDTIAVGQGREGSA